MWQRCHNPKAPDFGRYGGLGVSICAHWRSFAQFCEDMGDRPEGYTLDRIDSRKGYKPSNCRWATPTQQARNRRTSLGERGASKVKALARQGLTHAAIAKVIGKSASLVGRVVSGHYYGDVL